MNEWMKKISSPPRYRVIKSNFTANKRFIIMTSMSVFFMLIIFLSIKNKNFEFDINKTSELDGCYKRKHFIIPNYNSTYPINEPIKSSFKTIYNLIAIADLDTNSKVNNKKYASFIMKGRLDIDNHFKSATVQFSNDLTEVTSQYAYGDRGMELSELVTFNGRLYSCDDRTGIIYEIKFINNEPIGIPWVILVDGNGQSTGKGFKCEWMSVKDNRLYVGGLGKEWTTPKGILNFKSIFE
jgi:soluble calcium-activated nucleotidase 1